MARNEHIGGGRLIPAWAGKTKPALYALERRQAHPRVGGENSKLQAALNEGRGSSPRGRGKRHRLPERIRCIRLIPAWAGKTFRSGGASLAIWAHPRVGGENDGQRNQRVPAPGSSPRGRGKRPTANDVGGFHGLIPAWAGKTGG